MTTSRCELDAPAGDSLKRSIFYGENETVFDWVQEVSIKGPQTKYPIWLMVMCSEAYRVGQAIWILQQLGIPRKSLGEFKTDSVAFKVPNRKRDAIRKHIEDIRHCDLHAIKDTYAPVATLSASGGERKKQRRLDDTIALVPIASDEPVYRINPTGERDKMVCRPELPQCKEWQVSLPSLEWTDLDPEDTRAHILGGGSCLICGHAGTGKS